MRQRFERVSALCYIRGRAHIRDFAKGLFFRADPSLRAGTVSAPLRSVQDQGPPDLVHLRVLADTQSWTRSHS